jgi:hypothetical protein
VLRRDTPEIVNGDKAAIFGIMYGIVKLTHMKFYHMTRFDPSSKNSARIIVRTLALSSGGSALGDRLDA